MTKGDYLHVTQVHTLEGTLSQEQESHTETTQQLKGYREMLAAADANKRQLEAQMADLQAQQANSQAALQNAQEKLTASETELAQAGQDAKQLQQQVQKATTKTRPGNLSARGRSCSRTYGLHSLRHHSMCAILTECRLQSVNHEFCVPVFYALGHFQRDVLWALCLVTAVPNLHVVGYTPAKSLGTVLRIITCARPHFSHCCKLMTVKVRPSMG